MKKQKEMKEKTEERIVYLSSVTHHVQCLFVVEMTISSILFHDFPFAC